MVLVISFMKVLLYINTDLILSFSECITSK